MRTYWHNRIARSSVTLPVAAVITTLLWWLPQGGYSLPYLLGWVVCAVGMFFIIEMAAQNALIRVRSRMVSSLFLLLMAACGFMHELCTGLLLQFALVVSLFSLLRTCEKARPELDTFHAYLCLSLGSLLWPPLLLLAIVLLMAQAFFLRSLTLRSFGAFLLGLLTPYVFWSSALFMFGDINTFVAHVRGIIAPVLALVGQVQHEIELAQTFDWPSWTSIQGERLAGYASYVLLNRRAELAALVLVVLVGSTGSLFYISHSYDDKIRVRMCHYSFIFVLACLAVWLVLQPWMFSRLFPLLLLTAVPPCAAWAVFSRSWFARFWFIVLIICWLCVAAMALTPSAVVLQIQEVLQGLHM